MDQVGQWEPKDSAQTAAEQPTPPTQPRQQEQENAGSDGPQLVTSPAVAGATANVSMAVNGTGNGNGVVVAGADAQSSNPVMARPASPASHPQTTALDATSSTASPGDLAAADRRLGWNFPAAGTLESPQAPPQQVQPPQPPQVQHQPPQLQQPQSQYHPQPQPYSPHPQPSASVSASALPPPHPAALPSHGAPHPQTLRHLHPHPHPHPHPSPPPPQHQLYEHERVIQLQQPAPQHPSHAQIPPGPQYQQQYPQHQQQPHHHHHHHHQHQHQQPQPHAPVTPVTPLPSTLPPLHQPHAPPFHSHSQPQPQPQPVLRSQPLRLPPSLSNKPVIMDPPGTRKPGQVPQSRSTMGFPSPTQDYATINPKFVDDCTRLNFAIQQSMPESVRRIVRDHWEKCLLGSEFHQAFIVSPSHGYSSSRLSAGLSHPLFIL